MVDFLEQGCALVQGPGDKMAKLRSFGDAFYDPWLRDGTAITEVLRKRNSDQDVGFMLAIVRALGEKPMEPRGKGSKLGGRHFVSAFVEIARRYEQLKKDKSGVPCDFCGVRRAAAPWHGRLRELTVACLLAHRWTTRGQWTARVPRAGSGRRPTRCTTFARPGSGRSSPGPYRAGAAEPTASGPCLRTR
jgi:hypothetical protein